MDIIEVIKSGKCNEADLLEFITNNDIEIAIAAAESELATEPILDIAAHDRDKKVRMAALNNPNIGDKTLKFLFNDQDEDIVALAKSILKRRN